VVVFLLCLFLLAPLGFNVAAMTTEWRLTQLDQEEGNLGAERSSLRAKVAALSSSQRLQEEAVSLGLSAGAVVDFVMIGEDGAEAATAPATGEDPASSEASAGTGG
jgi:hypothetical protein